MPMDRSEPKSAEPKGAPPTAGKGAKAPAAPSADATSPDSSAPRPWLIRKRGAAEVLRCPDLTTLRQWIVERRIARDDEISRSGQRFRRMGSVVELESLFYSAEQERAQQRRNSGQFAQVPAPAGASAASAPRLTPVPTPVATTPGSGAPSARPTPVPATQAQKAEPVEAKKPEPAAAKKPDPAESKKTEPTPAKKPEPAEVEKPAAPPSASAPAAEKKPADAVGPVKVTPPPGLAASAGGLSPMRLARKDPNRGKPQAMPGMAGSVQAAMRAAGGPAPAKPAAAPAGEAKRAESAAPTSRPPAAAPTPPARAAAGKPAAAGSAKGDPASSGAQTAVFNRQDKDGLDEEDDDNVTRKLPPADSRATERQPVRPRDPVEDAILHNDPVPRHLKEAAEGGETIRKRPADVDSTEYLGKGDRAPKSRGPLLLVLAVVVIGGVIWYSSQSGDTPSTPTPPSTPSTNEQPTSGTTEPAKGSTPGSEPSGEVKEPGTTPPTAVVEPLPPGTGATGNNPPAVTPPSEPEKPTAAKPEAAKPEAAKPEAAKPAAPQAAAPKTEPAKPAPAKTEPEKPAVAATATTPPGTAPAAAKPTVSLEELRKKISEDIPKGFDDQMELAQRLVERYKYDSAQALYEYMLTYASAVPAIHNGLGTCAFEKNRGDEAISHFRDALERRPNYSAAVFGLAKTYHRLKNDKEQALVYYKKYLELNPKGSAAALSREAIAKLEGQPPPSAPTPPPAAPAPEPSP